jgi:hypothetical protein
LGQEGRLADSKRKGGKLHLVLKTDRRDVEIALPGWYEIGAPLRKVVKDIQGVVDLQDF